MTGTRIPSREERRSFLSTFYKTNGAASGGDINESRPWWSRLNLDSDEPPNPTILRRGRGDADEWYAIAFDEPQARRLSEDVASFLGLTYSDFTGLRSPLGTDPVGRAVIDFTGGHGFRFCSLPSAGQAFSRLLDVWRLRPAGRTLDDITSVGRLRRDFEIAVTVGRRAEAEEILRALEEGSYLSRENLLFLRVRMLDGLGAWGELLGLPDLPDLIARRRPVAVTDALLRAVYRVRLAGLENDPGVALEKFRDEVYPQFAPLFGFRSGLRSPEAKKAFMLLAVGRTPQDLELRDEILRSAVPEVSAEDTAFMRAVAALSPSADVTPPAPLPSDPAARCAALRERGDYDRLLTTAYELAPGVERTRLLLECAYHLQTTLSHRAAQEAVLSLGSAEQELVFADELSRKVWLTIRPIRQEKTPASWVEWCETVVAVPDWAQAESVARRGVTEWARPWEYDPSEINKLAESLEAVFVEAPRVLYAALPHVAGLLLDDEAWPRRELRRIYDACVEIIRSGEQVGDSDFDLFNEFVDAVLSLGATQADYDRYIVWAADLCRRHGSVSRVDRMLDLLDIFIVQPSPAPDRRIDLAVAAEQVLVAHTTRLRPEQVKLFTLLAQEIGYETSLDEATDAATTESWPLRADALRGKLVAIYTLTESAGRQAQERLEQIFPGVDVRLCHDMVASPRLRDLASRAELFVVATRSATHAATEEIRRYRGNMPSVYPTGKGMASIVAGVANYIREAAYMPAAA